MTKELEFAKAERERLRGELAELERKRAKLCAADEILDAAEAALATFERAEASAVSQWADTGCGGTRPGPDVAKHSGLTAKVTAAGRDVSNATPALEVLDAAESDLRARLEANRRGIADAAAAKIAADYAVQGGRAEVLRGELAEIENALVGGYTFWRGFSDDFYSSTGKRNPPFDGPWKSAEAGLPAIGPGESRPMMTREEIAKHRAAFNELQAG